MPTSAPSGREAYRQWRSLSWERRRELMRGEHARRGREARIVRGYAQFLDDRGWGHWILLALGTFAGVAFVPLLWGEDVWLMAGVVAATVDLVVGPTLNAWRVRRLRSRLPEHPEPA